MLILTRRPGEKILIGEDIVIEVKRVVGHQVVIGIAAPQDKLILRDELLPISQKDKDAA